MHITAIRGKMALESKETEPLSETAPMSNESPRERPSEPRPTGESSPAPEHKPWEDYLSPSGLVETPADGSHGSGWYKLGVACALLGVFVPLVFGPTAFTFGLLARDKKNPRALIPIILGLLVTLYGAVYYRLATTGSIG